ncbi:MAG: hypothetical protein K6A05_00600 [Lachnospiraceae bacterium]|nr:hypothetical protein [Lachnospiraceae bacterium]
MNEDWTAYWDYVGPKSRDEVDLDEESAKLYSEFLENQVPVTYDASQDGGSYLRLSDVLTQGQSYTLSEINQLLEGAIEFGEDFHYEITDTAYIDCGMDGDIEMLATVGASEFQLHMVIKNVDGSLKIRYSVDSWSRSYATFKYTGEIDDGGSGGATSHVFGTGFLDADCNYHFLDRTYEELIGEFGAQLSDKSELGLNENWLYFEERVTFAEDNPDNQSYYYFSIQDENSNPVKDDPSDPENPHVKLRQYYEAKDLQCATEEELEQMKDSKRKELGVSDEIYHYGEELQPK